MLLILNYLNDTMGAIHKYMFVCALVVIVGLKCVHGYNAQTNYRHIHILETKLETVIAELKYVKEDLKVEHDKSVEFENKFNALIGEKTVTTFDKTDSDLPGHQSVVDQQQAIDKVSSTIEQRIYQAMNDEKKVRQQFQKQMQNDFKAEKENMEIRFIALNETVSAVIDNKLETIEYKVRDSVTVINESISSIENLSMHVQQNGGDIISLRVESDQLNTTLLEHGAIFSSLNDSLVVVQASVFELQKDSHHNIEVNSKTVHQNNEAINNLLEQSQHGNTTLLRHDAVLSSLKDSLVDIHASVMELYKEHTNSTVYTDCYNIHKHTSYPTGQYLVRPNGLNKIVRVMCDMDTDGGGWSVFQYRYDGSVEFYRNFSDYENGFGRLAREFWLGLRYIQFMTTSAPTVLRIDMESAGGSRVFQTFDDFSLSERPDYKLNIGASSGTTRDALKYDNGSRFTTQDHPDKMSNVNCAVLNRGAWWYSEQFGSDFCGLVNLNGDYGTPGKQSEINNGGGGKYY